MKEKIIAAVLLVTIISAVTTNTLFIGRQSNDIVEALSNINYENENATRNAESIYDDFKRGKMLMSLTVSHEDITRIEECFIELIDTLEEGDVGEADKINNRLKFYLEHLRRLSGFNIDSII